MIRPYVRATGYRAVRTPDELAQGLRKGEEVYAAGTVWRKAEELGLVLWNGEAWVLNRFKDYPNNS